MGEGTASQEDYTAPPVVYRIHGDNVVECERTLDWIRASLGSDLLEETGPHGSPVCPTFRLRSANVSAPLEFTFFPGFGRWDEDIIQHLKLSGAVLREAADAILTRVAEGSEIPLAAMEYCAALPAGNQAWQRSGRAYSFGAAGVPFFYIAELGGFELADDRSRKAARMPNPAVPFSYITYSEELATCVVPVLIPSPVADEALLTRYQAVFSEGALLEYLRAVILCEDSGDAEAALKRRALEFVLLRSAEMRPKETLAAAEWTAAYTAISEGSTLGEYVAAEAPRPWSKTAYIKDLTESARALMEIAKVHGFGLTSSKLPICVVPKEHRSPFAEEVGRLYDDLPVAFREWMRRPRELVICWIMGFKPRGDDARPDRGLPPFARMLAGQETDLLSVVYGPAPAASWTQLEKDPIRLGQQNGLWEAIIGISDAILIDSKTDKVTRRGFVRSDWEETRSGVQPLAFYASPVPTKIGEQDVDTVLHLLLGRLGRNHIFEGLCNPPGGDWSGLSVQSLDRTREYRWLSLPRVSGEDRKRPDHVLQIFASDSQSILLAIESKERVSRLDENIGPRLIKYVGELIGSTASVERECSGGPWQQSGHQLNPSTFSLASAVAFIADPSVNLMAVANEAEADIAIACSFSTDTATCIVLLEPRTQLGGLVADHIARIETPASIEVARG